MNSYELIKLKIEEKNKKITNQEDLKKCNFIKMFFLKKSNVFNASKDAVIGMLIFLEFDESEIEKIYDDLLSVNNFKESFPYERVVK